MRGVEAERLVYLKGHVIYGALIFFFVVGDIDVTISWKIPKMFSRDLKN